MRCSQQAQGGNPFGVPAKIQPFAQRTQKLTMPANLPQDLSLRNFSHSGGGGSKTTTLLWRTGVQEPMEALHHLHLTLESYPESHCAPNCICTEIMATRIPRWRKLDILNSTSPSKRPSARSRKEDCFCSHNLALVNLASGTSLQSETGKHM